MKGSNIGQILLLCLLAGIIAVAVVLLYSGSDGRHPSSSEKSQSSVYAEGLYPALGCVPADAAAVVSSSSAEELAGLLSDSTTMVSSLLGGTGSRSIAPFVSSIGASVFSTEEKSSPGAAAMSLHYDRGIVPLLVFETSGIDVNVLKSKASASSLYCETLGGGAFVVVSPSSAVLTSSKRHLEAGTSVLGQPSFYRAAAKMRGRPAIFVVGKYWSKLISKVIRQPFSSIAAGFLSGYADVLTIVLDKDGRNLHISTGTGDDLAPSYASNHFDRSRIEAPKVMPSNTVFAVSQTTGGMDSFIRSKKDFMDANGRLPHYDDSAEKWARGLDVLEVAKAVVRQQDEEVHQILFLRLGKPQAEVLLKGSGIEVLKDYKPSVIPYAYPGYAAIQFGDVFSTGEESFFFYRDGWMAVGDGKILSALLTEEYESLEAFMKENSIRSKGTSPFFWFDASAYSSRSGEIFFPDFIAPFDRSLKGLMRKILCFYGSEGDSYALSSIKTSAKDNVRITVTVDVPKGPFTVTNFRTKAKNTLVQNANKSISLVNEKGKSVWTVPFEGDICGRVSDVDCYSNGKIQFLFASGTRYYVLDLLGRYVRGYPADTGKEILLGPEVHTLRGAGTCTVVLHRDNTIGLYDLKGKPLDGWKGIAPEEQIVALPELVLESGKRLWKVTTPSYTITYPFLGGKPLGKPVKRQ